MIFKNWLDTCPKMEMHEPIVYSTLLGGVSRGFWSLFLDWDAQSAIFWHLKTGNFANAFPFSSEYQADFRKSCFEARFGGVLPSKKGQNFKKSAAPQFWRENSKSFCNGLVMYNYILCQSTPKIFWLLCILEHPNGQETLETFWIYHGTHLLTLLNRETGMQFW